MMLNDEIDLGQARRIAEEQARIELSGFAPAEVNCLQDDYLEAEHCWMFFKKKDIVVPPEASLGINWAYVVSKHGKFSLVQDFSSDSKKLNAYLKTMSDYFARKGI